MYLKRKVDTFFREWKADPARKPLIIKGSRQVGKTESIRKFAAEEYESVVEINFVRDENTRESPQTAMRRPPLSKIYR